MMSILKPNRPIESLQTTPMQPRPIMMPDNTDDVAAYHLAQHRDPDDRKRAMAQYQSDNAADESSTTATAKVRLNPYSTATDFRREDTPLSIKTQTTEQEPLIIGDLRNSFTARAVDLLIDMAHRGGTAGIATNGPEQLTTILKGYHMVSDGEIMTEPELKVLVLQQLSDLKERGMERLSDIYNTSQKKVDRMMKEMEVDKEDITDTEEQDYEEARVIRRPDYIVQRFLGKRVLYKTIGLYAHPYLIHELNCLLEAPLLLE